MKFVHFEGTLLKKKKVTFETDSGDTLELELTALPPDYNDILADELSEPIPPQSAHPIRGDDNKFLRDVAGTPIRIPDYENPIFRYQMLSTIAVIFHGLRGDKNIEFDVEYTPRKVDGFKFYDSIRTELKGAGFSIGDIAYLGSEITKLSGLSREDIEGARDDFLDQNETEEMSMDSD